MAIFGPSFVRTNTGRIVSAYGGGGRISLYRYADSVTPPLPAGTLLTPSGNSVSMSIRGDQLMDLVYDLSGTVSLITSRDRGRTWSSPVTLASGYRNVVSDWDAKRNRLVVVMQDTSAADWYWLTVDLDSSGVLTVVSSPVLIVAAAGDLTASVRVGPSGQWGFAWSDAGAVYYQQSEDGGATWTAPVTVVASDWRNPTLCWCPKQQLLCLAMQTVPAITFVPLSSNVSHSWFLASSPLDSDGKPTAWYPSSYTINPALIPGPGGGHFAMQDLSFMDYGQNFVNSACLRADADGRLTFAYVPMVTTSNIVQIIRSAVVTASGKWRSEPQT